MGKKWLGTLRRKLRKSSQKTVVILHTTREEDNGDEKKAIAGESMDSGEGKRSLSDSEEDVAAIKIQAIFRGHLARKAYRALRSLVNLQAVVRGVSVRRQTRIALYCMNTLVRLQLRVRARKLLTTTTTTSSTPPHLPQPPYSTTVKIKPL